LRIRAFLCSAAVLVAALIASPANAELVFFNTGRTLSVKGHRVEGDSLVLVLRGGGEIVCETSIVARFEPDVELHVLPPLCPLNVWPADFSQGGVLIDRAHAAAMEWLAADRPTTGQVEYLGLHQHHPT